MYPTQVLAKLIPDTVSPSQITLLGLVVIIQAWYYTLFAPPRSGVPGPDRRYFGVLDYSRGRQQTCEKVLLHVFQYE